MNIKGVFGNVMPNPLRSVERIERGIKSDSTHDREGNGQQTFDQPGDQKKQDPMTPEQIERALEHLRQLPAVREHQWVIELLVLDNRRFVAVKDSQGQIIRRFPESDLWTLPLDLDDPKGQLLKKMA